MALTAKYVGNLLFDFYNEYIDKLKYEGYFDNLKTI